MRRRRMFRPGEAITDPVELFRLAITGQWTMLWRRPVHAAWLAAQQASFLAHCARRGWYRRAIVTERYRLPSPEAFAPHRWRLVDGEWQPPRQDRP